MDSCTVYNDWVRITDAPVIKYSSLTVYKTHEKFRDKRIMKRNHVSNTFHFILFEKMVLKE